MNMPSPHALNPPSLTGPIDGSHYLDVEVLPLLGREWLTTIDRGRVKVFPIGI